MADPRFHRRRGWGGGGGGGPQSHTERQPIIWPITSPPPQMHENEEILVKEEWGGRLV